MGTRSLLILRDGSEAVDEGVIALVYRQFDGYPTGMGADLQDALKVRDDEDRYRIIVNGYSDPAKQINGPGDMAARVVAYLKSAEGCECGNVYLYPIHLWHEDCGQDYIYTLTAWGNEPEKGIHLRLTTDNVSRVLYDGPIEEADMDAIEAAMGG